MGCGIAWSLVVVVASGILSGRPEARVLLDNLPSREACMAARHDAGLIELGQRVICVPAGSVR